MRFFSFLSFLKFREIGESKGNIGKADFIPSKYIFVSFVNDNDKVIIVESRQGNTIVSFSRFERLDRRDI